MLTLINQVTKKNRDRSVWDKTFEHVGIKRDKKLRQLKWWWNWYLYCVCGCPGSYKIHDTNLHVAKKRRTRNISLIIKGKKRPFPGRSQQLTAPTRHGRFERPSYFSAIVPLRPPTNPHEVKHSCYSRDIALAQNLPLNCLQATSRWGITDQPLLLLHLIYVSINDWYM